MLYNPTFYYSMQSGMHSREFEANTNEGQTTRLRRNGFACFAGGVIVILYKGNYRGAK